MINVEQSAQVKQVTGFSLEECLHYLENWYVWYDDKKLKDLIGKEDDRILKLAKKEVAIRVASDLKEIREYKAGGDVDDEYLSGLEERLSFDEEKSKLLDEGNLDTQDIAMFAAAQIRNILEEMNLLPEGEESE